VTKKVDIQQVEGVRFIEIFWQDNRYNSELELFCRLVYLSCFGKPNGKPKAAGGAMLPVITAIGEAGIIKASLSWER
jgi:hypothetical protein